MATSDVGGRLLTLTDRNLRKQTFSYDDLARVTEEDWFNADGSSAGSSTTSRDPDNNVLSVTNSSGTVQFTYDNLNRVKTAKDVWGVTLTYTTDALDRHTRIDDSLGGSLTATYDVGGELTDETRSAPLPLQRCRLREGEASRRGGKPEDVTPAVARPPLGASPGAGPEWASLPPRRCFPFRRHPPSFPATLPQGVA